jgi:hypothetical protein
MEFKSEKQLEEFEIFVFWNNELKFKYFVVGLADC